MITNAIVLVIHVCTALQYGPFLSDCTAIVASQKDQQTCERKMKQFNDGEIDQRYFGGDKIAFGKTTLAAPARCEKMPVPIADTHKNG